MCIVKHDPGTSRRPVPERARLLHQRGRAAGEGSDYGHALASFGEARALAHANLIIRG